MSNVKLQLPAGPRWSKLLELSQKYPVTANADGTEHPPIMQAAGLSVDLSRCKINQDVMQSLLALAEECQLEQQIAALLAGEPVNNTENRAAHHTALRAPSGGAAQAEIDAVQNKIRSITQQLHHQQWRGSGDNVITDVVNIGIGGSDLGPRMACSALASLKVGAPRVHFVANIDPRDLELTLETLQPENTLFIISSKSFGTTETLENALSARQWLLQSISEQDLGKHVVAVSSNVEKAVAFGVEESNILPMWDWVGGRYSLWSAIGLPIAIAVGYDNFRRLLNGAHAMDQHFASTPLAENVPTLLALMEVWYVNLCDAKSVAVLPYSHELRLFPDYLQQLTMESNGKGVDKSGNALTCRSCPTLWGSAGTIGQHSFHQLLHQGTELIPVDFILPLQSASTDNNKQAHLVANALAQSKALSDGKSAADAKQELLSKGVDAEEAERLATHKAIPGNRPNTIIAMDQLTPENLGALVALYEHKVFAQSVIWGINAFDQWGVELGKQLSTPIFAALNDDDNATTSDSTTQYWIDRFKATSR